MCVYSGYKAKECAPLQPPKIRYYSPSRHTYLHSFPIDIIIKYDFEHKCLAFIFRFFFFAVFKTKYYKAIIKLISDEKPHPKKISTLLVHRVFTIHMNYTCYRARDDEFRFFHIHISVKWQHKRNEPLLLIPMLWLLVDGFSFNDFQRSHSVVIP